MLRKKMRGKIINYFFAKKIMECFAQIYADII